MTSPDSRAAALFIAGSVAACNGLLGTPEPALRDAGVAVDSSIAVDSSVAPAETAPEMPDRTLEASDGQDGDVDSSDASLPDVFDASSLDVDAGEAGISPPVLLAGSPDTYSGLKSLYGLTVLGDMLFGTDWYRDFALVYRTSTSTRSLTPQRIFPTQPDATANGAASPIVTDGTRIFFGVYRDDNGWPGGIYSIDPQGNGGLLLDAAVVSKVGYLAADSQYLYWASLSSPAYIGRANKDGSNPTQFNVARKNAAVVATGGRVYFSTTSGLVSARPDNLDSVSSSYSGSTNVDAFDVGPEYVVWLDMTIKKIYRNAIAAPGVPQDITSAQFSVTRQYGAIITDGKSIYVFNSDLGPVPGATIQRLGVDGSWLGRIAVPDAIMGITQDPGAIYFCTYGQDALQANAVLPPPYSAVWKLAK
jgi:hypothetical protein